MNTFKKIAMTSLLGLSVLPGFASNALVPVASRFATSVATSQTAQVLLARLAALGAAFGIGASLPVSEAPALVTPPVIPVTPVAPVVLGRMEQLRAFGATKLAQAKDGLVALGGKVVEVGSNVVDAIRNDTTSILGVCDLAVKGYGAFGLARGAVAAVKAVGRKVKSQSKTRTALETAGFAAVAGAAYYFGLPGMVTPLVPAFVTSENMLRAAGALHVGYNVTGSANETSGLGFCSHIVNKDGDTCNAQPLGQPSVLGKLRAGIFGVSCPKHQHGWFGGCNHTK